MAIGLAGGLLSGALTQYLTDEDASDRLKGQIVDATARKLFEVEIPNAIKEINKFRNVKNILTNENQRLAEFADLKGFLESGDIRIANELINKYIGTTQDTRESFKKKISIMKPEQFKSAFGSQSLLDLRTQNLKTKESTVNNLFGDRSQIRDLLIAPGAPEGGIGGFLFGDRVRPKDQIAVRGRLESAVSQDQKVVEPSQAATQSIFDIRGKFDPNTKEIRDSELDFVFSPATIYLGSIDEIGKAVAPFRQFDQSLQTGKDSFGNTVIVGFSFQGNKQVEYNAFVSKMQELAPQYRDSVSGKINLTALAQASETELRQQIEGSLSATFKDYRKMTQKEKSAAGFTGLKAAEITYQSTGFSDSFNTNYPTDQEKKDAIFDTVRDLKNTAQQLFFATSIPTGIMIEHEGQKVDLKRLVETSILKGR